MSPYRVFVINPKTEDKQILAAMLSINKLTKDRNIYIIDKVIPIGADMETITSIAHKMTGVRNSTILDSYTIELDNDTHKYYLTKSKYFGIINIFPERYHLQSDCLKAAMEDYMSKNNLCLISVL